MCLILLCAGMSSRDSVPRDARVPWVVSMEAFFDACSIDIEWLPSRCIDLLISHFNVSFCVSPYAATSVGGFCDYPVFMTFRVAVCLLRSCQTLRSSFQFCFSEVLKFFNCKNGGRLFDLFIFSFCSICFISGWLSDYFILQSVRCLVFDIFVQFGIVHGSNVCASPFKRSYLFLELFSALTDCCSLGSE